MHQKSGQVRNSSMNGSLIQSSKSAFNKNGDTFLFTCQLPPLASFDSSTRTPHVHDNCTRCYLFNEIKDTHLQFAGKCPHWRPRRHCLSYTSGRCRLCPLVAELPYSSRNQLPHSCNHSRWTSAMKKQNRLYPHYKGVVFAVLGQTRPFLFKLVISSSKFRSSLVLSVPVLSISFPIMSLP